MDKNDTQNKHNATNQVCVVSMFEITKSMKQCHSSGAALPPVILEILRIAWKPSVHYRLHNSRPRVLKLSQMNHNSLKSISIFSCHVRLDLPRGFFPPVFKTRSMYVCFLFHFSPISTDILSSLVRYDGHNNCLILYQLMHIHKTFHIKTLKLLRHVSIQGSNSGTYIFLAKVTFKN